MEFPASHFVPWQYLLPSNFLFPYNFTPQNYFHWTQTPESHIFSANIPGVRKEDVRVEVEDSIYLIIRISIYLIIRTEAIDKSRDGTARKFKRKFRIPGRVDIDRINAGYENCVLRVTVPKCIRRSFYIDLTVVSDRLEDIARAP